MSASVLPSQIGPYRVLRPIARGGMAEVYEVEELATGEHVALKLLMSTGVALPRFNREYEAMIRLNHPNIVRVYHYGFFGDTPWLTMELIEGTPVQAYAKRIGRPGSPERNEEVVRIAHDLSRALHHIHTRGLIHRDLKSANVLVLPDGRVKLLDFGTAKVSDALEQITREGEFVGTFAYASPEQLTGKELDHRADLYSLGVLLYRLATGKRPFNAKDLAELARQHVKQAPKPPRELVPSLPEWLETIILTLLEKNPDKRPQNGIEVAEALEEFSGHPLLLPGTLDVDLSGDQLVGREDQVALLRQVFDAASPGSMALIVGLQGSGRHRLMQFVERDAASRSWKSFSAFFRRGRGDLGPLCSLLIKVGRSFGASSSGEVKAATRAVVRVDGATHRSIAVRREVLRESAATLLRARCEADKGPVVLVLHGLQNAGAVGFEVLVALRELATQAELPVIFVADCLETADDPDSLARKRLPDAHRITLPPLAVRDVALLVGAILNRRPPPNNIARMVHEASGGLPTYVEEVVKGLVSEGILQAKGRDANRIEWAAKEDLVIPVPGGARQRVMDGLAELPAGHRRVLEALAVAGGEASPTILAGGLHRTNPDELGPALEDLVRKGWISLLDLEEGTWVRWRQRLAQEVILEQLHPCRRHVLRGLLIDQVINEPPFVAQILLLVDDGRLEDALWRAYDWAQYHLASNQPVTALEALDPVVQQIKGRQLDVATEDLARLYLLHTTCLLMVRPMDMQTGRSLLQATKLGRHIDDAVFQAELSLTRARVQRTIGHIPNYQKYLNEAWGHIAGAQATGVGTRIARELGWISMVTGHGDQAAQWQGKARRIALEVDDAGLKAHADVGVATWQYTKGLYIDAERTAAQAAEVFRDTNDMEGMSMALPVWADSLRHQGRFSEALSVLTKVGPLMREQEAPSFYVRLLLSMAWLEADLYRLGRAQECVDELGATLRRGEHLDLRLRSDLVWGRILLASGEFVQADLKLADVRKRAIAAGLVNIAASARSLRAETLASFGEMAQAVREYDGALADLGRAWDVPSAVAATISRARALAELADPVKLFEPISDHLKHVAAVVPRLELHLAVARHKVYRGEDPTADFLAARKTLDRLRQNLNDTDRAALRVHPWTRQIRIGLGEGPRD